MIGTYLSPKALAALFLLLTATSPTHALGINCRGSALCTASFLLNPRATGNEAKVLSDWIQGIEADGYKPPAISANRIYKTGEQIACYQRSGICAFLQNTGDRGGTGAEVRKLAPLIPKHGCKICGSVPTDVEKNDVKNGQLTFNYVSRPSCNGIC